MSRKPSKFRKAKRAQRARVAKPDIYADMATEAMKLGTKMHREIGRVGMLAAGYGGDSHIGEIVHTFGGLDIGRHIGPQLRAYAAAAGLDEVTVITGGDLLHHKKD